MCSSQPEMLPHYKQNRVQQVMSDMLSYYCNKGTIYGRAKNTHLHHVDRQIFEGTLDWLPSTMKRHLPVLLIGTLPVLSNLAGPC
jgi:hypothetical protein